MQHIMFRTAPATGGVRHLHDVRIEAEVLRGKVCADMVHAVGRRVGRLFRRTRKDGQ